MTHSIRIHHHTAIWSVWFYKLYNTHTHTYETMIERENNLWAAAATTSWVAERRGNENRNWSISYWMYGGVVLCYVFHVSLIGLWENAAKAKKKNKKTRKKKWNHVCYFYVNSHNSFFSLFSIWMQKYNSIWRAIYSYGMKFRIDYEFRRKYYTIEMCIILLWFQLKPNSKIYKLSSV